MEIVPKQPSRNGPEEWFRGQVWIDSIVAGHEAPRPSVLVVRFAPGSRTAWHSHEVGQTLFVTEGRGLVQSRGDRIVEMHEGDVVYTPGGEEHWHGATADHFMSHLSITEGATQWGAHVTDAEYDAERG